MVLKCKLKKLVPLSTMGMGMIRVVINLLIAFSSFAGLAYGQMNANLPIVQNVGVIPVQWDDEQVADSQFYEAKKLIEAEYSNAVRSSRKYRVVNDDLVAGQWSQPSTREELVKSQEIDGFFSLQVQVKSDIVTFILRLMNPKMETYLLESSNTNVAELKTATRGQLIGMIENLVYKMLNRIPVDAHVTSLQGRYLTISGGQLAGLQIGDEVDIVRSFILSRHPANGSWMNIKTTKLGTATVVEVKKYTSVAKLENMIAEDAIRIGDGMRVPRIKPRAKFKDEELGRPKDTDRINDPVVINPMYPGDTQVQPVLPEKNVVAAKPGTPAPVTAAPEQTTAAEEEKLDYEVPGTGDLDGLVDMLVDYGKGYAGMRLWNYSGSASASAKFPIIFINHGRVMLGKSMTPDINVEVLAHANIGTMNRGSFFGFGGGGRIYMHKPLSQGRRWKAGAEGQFNSMAVTEQTYGGADIATGGGFIGMEGPFQLSESLITYYAEFALFPVNLGQHGVGGTKRTIQSSFNFRMTLAGEYHLTSEQQKMGELAWGGQIEIENYTYSLDSNKKISGSSFNILGTGAWKF